LGDVREGLASRFSSVVFHLYVLSPQIKVWPLPVSLLGATLPRKSSKVQQTLHLSPTQVAWRKL
jgi:hypothetical protein